MSGVTGLAATKVLPTETLIRDLTALQLYDEALREVQYAQRVWGDSAALQATTAWIRNRQGLGLRAQERFNAVRGAITLMRRAYPQFLAAGGEAFTGRAADHLPARLLAADSEVPAGCTIWIRISSRR